MTVSRGAQVVAEARRWIGTPYLHQASLKGVGTDCLGLLRGVWRDLNGDEPEVVPAYTADWSEADHDEVLWRAARQHLVEKPLTQPKSGDVLLFRMRTGMVAKHIGIAAVIGANPTFIHAYSQHAVVESPLSLPWQRRVVSRFLFK